MATRLTRNGLRLIKIDPYRRSARHFLLISISLALAVPTFAYEPNPTTPVLGFQNHSGSSDPIDQDRIGDGFWYDTTPHVCTVFPDSHDCHQDSNCPYGVSNTGYIKPPVVRLVNNNTQLQVEYWTRNAYCVVAQGTNPPDVYLPQTNSLPYKIRVVFRDANGSVLSSIDYDPYWEHGQFTVGASLSCSPAYAQAVFVLNEFGIGGTQQTASSNIVGPIGQDANGRSCLDDRRKCDVPNSAGGPINVGSGNMHYDEPLFSVSENVSPMVFTLAYNSREVNVGPVGIGFTHPFAQSMFPLSGSTRLLKWLNERGEATLFYSFNPGVEAFAAVWPGEATGSVILDNSAQTYTLTTLDGTKVVFSSSNGQWQSTTDRWGNAYVGTYTPNLTSIKDPELRTWTLVYSGSLLVSITDGSSNVWQFGYDGSNHLTKIADPAHTLVSPWRTYAYVTGSATEPTVLASVADDAGKVLEAHEYDSAGRAKSSWAADPSIAGANARSIVTLTYDSPTQTTVKSRIDATPTDLTSVFTFKTPGGRFLPTSINGNCPSCGGGGDDFQSFSWDDLNHMLSKIVGIGGDQVETDYTYDINGQLLTRVEAVGKPETRTTTFAYGYVSPTGLPWQKFVTSVQEPSAGKPGAGNYKTTTYSWNSTGTSETALTAQASGFLLVGDAADTTYTTTTTFSPTHRMTEMDGPLPTAKTTYAFYPDNDLTTARRGRLQTQSVFTSSLAHLDSTYDNYDIFGTAKTVTDPNGVQTTRLIDPEGRVTSVTSKKPAGDLNEPPDYVTTYTFDTRDRLTKVTLPAGNKTQYSYEDGTNRLTETIRVDSAGNFKERLHLTLNVIGNKIQEDYQQCTSSNCSTSTTARTEKYAYDAHDRLQKNTHSDVPATHIDYTYDSRGNLLTVQDERHGSANTTYAYDFLNRLTKVTQTLTGASATTGSCTASAGTIATCYGYDVQDNLISVVDPNKNLTTYAYDDFKRLTSQVSPVSGTTSYGYDAGGNLTSSKDANNATTTRSYDWASRVLTAASTNSAATATDTVSYAYDDATAAKYGKGRLASMTDPMATTTYAYERRGIERQEIRTVPGSTNYTISYVNDPNGNRSSIVYPSGRTATYAFDFADRPMQLSATSPAVTYVSSSGTTYLPFGPLNAVNYSGNGTSKTISYNQRYQPTEIKLVKGASSLYDFFYVSDGVGNVTSICDATPCTAPPYHAFDRTFVYDDLNRLTTAKSGASLWGSAAGNGYTYDKMGNVTALTIGSRTVNFTFVGTTPKIATASDTTGTIGYDGAGNETQVGTGGANAFTYNPRNQLTRGEGLGYEYDGRGLRSAVFFTGPTVTSVSPTFAAQKTASYSLSLAIVGTGFLSGATVQIAGLTVNMVTFNSATSLTASVTVPAPSASIPSGYREVIVTNPGTNNPAGTLTNGFDLQRFTDALGNDSFSIYEWLATTKNSIIAEGFTTFADTTKAFNRNTNIKRRDMARWISRARLEPVETCGSNPTYCLLPTCTGPVQFTDVACNDMDWGWIQRFVDDGITAGCGSGIFCPDANLNRGQMAVFIEKGLNQLPVSLCDPANLRFSDVPCNHQFWGYIEKFAQDGITSGCGVGIYCPDNPVTRGQMAVFLSKAWQYTPPPVSDSLPGRYMLYTPEMNLLAETALMGAGNHVIFSEYLWFNGEPVAQSDGPSLLQQYWTFTDHLGTALRQYDSTGTQYWIAQYEPYGRIFNLQTANRHEPLRLPGQEAEELNISSDGNGSSKRFYNIFRWYRPNWGRYSQTDPLGLGVPASRDTAERVRERLEANLFFYAADNPLRFVDPNGLSIATTGCKAAASAAIESAAGKVDAAAQTCLRCEDRGPFQTLIRGGGKPPLSVECVAWNVNPSTGHRVCGNQPVNTTVIQITPDGQAEIPGCGCLQSTILHEALHVLGKDHDDGKRFKADKKCFSCSE